MSKNSVFPAIPYPTSDLPIIIIGAGTGGLCLAQGLKQAGIPVEVYERDRTRTGGLQGYRVGISPNGVRSLRDCLPEELFNTFIATAAREPRFLNMYTEQFRELITMDIVDQYQPGEVVKDYSVSRMTLRQVLLTGVEDIVQFDKKFSHYEDHGNSVTAHFEDGTSATGRILIGADGANSRIRQQYLPHATHTETGLVGIGGKLAITEQNKHLLPHKAFNGLSMMFDKRGQMCIVHVMEFPWQGNQQIKHGIGDTDAELIKQWPGLLFDNTTDYMMWGFSTSRSLLPENVLDIQGTELNELVLRDNMQGWHPNLRTMVRDSDPSTNFALGVRTSDPLDPWQPSRVTMLGDAIHTMTPGRGAGANTALRDAQLLRDKLLEVCEGSTELLDAIGDYEKQMREYSAVAVKESLQFMNDKGTARKPVIGPVSVFAQRTGMRIVDRVPALKNRMARDFQQVRDSELEKS